MKILKIKLINQVKNTILIILILLNIFINLKGLSEKKYYKEKINDYEKKLEQNDNLFIQDMNMISQEININCDTLFKNTPNGSFQLIYTYSGEECIKCIRQDIFALKEKLRTNNINNVIVLPVAENSRNVNIGLNADLEGFNYKRLNKGLVKFPYQDGIQRRFFAILTRNGKMLLPFFPEVSSPERTNAYLDFVFNKYFSSNQDSIRVIK